MSANHTYQLTVVIVNYNVEHFLDQCLDSVKKASEGLSIETIIVDNNSVDGSLKMLREKYPEFQLIDNKDNLGFSKANNQAMRIAKGKYVLLLNPDTVVAEDTFAKTIAFMDENPDAGGLGVHMIDGKGNFLPESKRGLPKPWVAFYKIFGLSKLFPKSKRFGQYHLGHLPEFETNKVDVLSGAFMLMRKSLLDEIGLLDEDYFMYGEDIDLSYRIKKGGLENYYFADTSIIHYKGESTKKSSVNYVLIFYKAMVIFAKKHFSNKNAKSFSLLINIAIYLRAFLALCSRFVRQVFLPFIDFIYIAGGSYLLTNYWKMSNIEFPLQLIKYSIPVYAITWIATTFFNGGYDNPTKLFKYLKGILFGTVLILIAYAVLPKSYQFSRLFIFLGALWSLVYYCTSRLFLHFFVKGRFTLFRTSKKSYAVIADDSEFQRISDLLRQTQVGIGEIEKYSLENIDVSTKKEIIFSAENIDYKRIIHKMKEMHLSEHDFKIAPPSTSILIGSNSIDTAGDLYLLNLNALNSKENTRKKRLFDLSISFFLLIFSPILIFFFKQKNRFISNSWSVLRNKRTFVGYSDTEMKTDVRLPKTKIGLLSPAEELDSSTTGLREKLNLLYARDYSMRKDLSIVLKSWNKLDS